jgi:hypothetical protein
MAQTRLGSFRPSRPGGGGARVNEDGSAPSVDRRPRANFRMPAVGCGRAATNASCTPRSSVLWLVECVFRGEVF